MTVKIVIKLAKETVRVNVDDLFYIDNTDLTTEYSKQAAYYARYTTLAARANLDAKKSTVHREREYAELDEHYREELRENGIKVTEPMIKEAIRNDEDYAEAVDAEVDAKHKHAILKSICEALKMRADMLISMGAHMRQEMSMTGMSIKDKRFQDGMIGLKDTMRMIKARRS